MELDALVESKAGRSFGEADLIASWRALADDLGLDPIGGEETVLTVARDASALATDELDPAFGGGWQWDLSDGVLKTVLASTLLAGVLAAAGVSGLTPIVIPTVLPFLFDLKRVRLEREANRVIRIIGARPNAFQRRGSRQELYASLPENVREHVSYEEFADYVDAAIQAGQVKEGWEHVQILPNGETVLRLTIR